MTLASIPSSIRAKLSNNAWICIGYLPVPQFNVHPDYQSTLANRVLHKAMDAVTAGLKRCAHDCETMPDAAGNIRLVYSPLVALTGDLIEHRDMSGIGGSVPTVSLATTVQFGDGVTYPPRTGDSVLALIRSVAKTTDPGASTTSFANAAKSVSTASTCRSGATEITPAPLPSLSPIFCTAFTNSFGTTSLNGVKSRLARWSSIDDSRRSTGVLASPTSDESQTPGR